jgi:hypothetical protein
LFQHFTINKNFAYGKWIVSLRISEPIKYKQFPSTLISDYEFGTETSCKPQEVGEHLYRLEKLLK